MPGPTIGTIRGTIEIDYDGAGIIRAERDIDRLEKSSGRAREGLNGLAKGLALGSAGVAAGFAVATKSAIDFEKQISAVKAVSGATSEEIEKIRKKALQLGEDTKYSASEAALAMEELVKAGLSVDEVLNGAADATVALAAAGEVELPYAATIAANAMNQFALSAKELPRVADIIAGTANASAIDVAEFGHSLSQVGAVAHLAGQDFEQTAVAIGLLGNAGIKGSDAGTSLKTMLSNLVPTTKVAKDMFKELGLNVGKSNNAFLNADGTYKDLRDIAGILNTKLKGLSEAQKQVALETIFGSDAIRAAAILTEQGATGFDKLSTSINGLTAAEVAATRMDNVAGSIEELKGSAETLAITIGTMLLPKVQAIVDKLQKAVDWFSGLSDETKSTIVQVVAITGALAGLMAITIKVVQFVSAFKAALAVMKMWTIWTKLAVVWTKIWTAAQWLLNIALNANPIGLIVVAILILIGIIVLLWTKCDWFREAVMWVWDHIKKAAAAVADWFMKTLWPTLKKVWEGLVAGFQWLGKALAWVWNFIVTGVKGWWMIFMKIWGFVGPLVMAVFNLIVSVVKTAWSIVSAIFAVWWTVVKAVFGAIWDFLVWVWNGIKTVIVGVISFVWPYIVNAINTIKMVWTTVWNFMAGIIETVWNWIKNLIISFFSWIDPYIRPIIQGIVDFIVKAWTWVKDTSSNVWNAIKTTISVVWNWIKSFIQSAVDRVIAIINGIKKMVDNVGKFFNQLKEAANGGVGTLIAFVKQIPGKILDALGNVGKMLYDSGKKIIQGLIDGISSMIGKLKDKVGDALGAIRNLLPFSPAKEGPFSGKGWTLYSGMELMRGFAQGVNKAASLPTDALSGALGSAATRFNPAATAGTSAGVTNNTTNTSSSVHIDKVEVKGVIDPSDPASSRKVVADLHKALDDYERSRK